MKSVIKLMAFSIITLILASCSRINVPILEKAPECNSSIEGFYHFYPQWNRGAPAIVVGTKSAPHVLYGKIISQDENGITFDPRSEGAFFDPEAKYYPYKELIAAIDSNKQLIYGQIPRKFYIVQNIEIVLESENEPDRKPYRIQLNADEQFGYCMPSGTYKVKTIYFIDNDGNMDYVVDLPLLKLAVQENRANYLGDLYLNQCPEDIQIQDTLLLATKIGSRVAGGGLLFILANELRGIIAVPKLYVTFNNNFDKKSKKSLEINFLRFEAHQ